jgi:hypothetical protein
MDSSDRVRKAPWVAHLAVPAVVQNVCTSFVEAERGDPDHPNQPIYNTIDNAGIEDAVGLEDLIPNVEGRKGL